MAAEESASPPQSPSSMGERRGSFRSLGLLGMSGTLESLITLKADSSSAIHIDQDPLLRTIASIRSQVREANDATRVQLREEIEESASSIKELMQVNLRELEQSVRSELWHLREACEQAAAAAEEAQQLAQMRPEPAASPVAAAVPLAAGFGDAAQPPPPEEGEEQEPPEEEPQEDEAFGAEEEAPAFVAAAPRRLSATIGGGPTSSAPRSMMKRSRTTMLANNEAAAQPNARRNTTVMGAVGVPFAASTPGGATVEMLRDSLLGGPSGPKGAGSGSGSRPSTSGGRRSAAGSPLPGGGAASPPLVGVGSGGALVAGVALGGGGLTALSNATAAALLPVGSAASRQELDNAQRKVSDLGLELNNHRHDMVLLERKVDSEFAGLAVRLEKFDEQVRGHNVKHAASERLLKSLEEAAATLAARSQELRAQVEELHEGKATAAGLAHLKAEVKMQDGLLRQTLEQATLGASLAPRVSVLENGQASLRAATQGADQAVGAVTETVQRVEAVTNTYQAQLKDAASRAELAQRGRTLEGRIRGVEALVGEMQARVRGFEGSVMEMRSKADRGDVALLQDSISTIAQTIKDREQSVLFGAKCLSCNRVFDDVQPDAGVVDLHMEKQKQHLLAQFDHALHNPMVDSMARIKMLAVKVGRPVTVSCESGRGGTAGSGTSPPRRQLVHGRDADSPACALEDVSLVPVRGSALADEGHGFLPGGLPPATPRAATTGAIGAAMSVSSARGRRRRAVTAAPPGGAGYMPLG